MSALYLRPLDPNDPHGLLAPSPGGGTVPTAYQRPQHPWETADALSRRSYGSFDGSGLDRAIMEDWPCALVLRTADGTVDPIGMSRAREVLAQVEGLESRLGVCFRACPYGQGWWEVSADIETRTYSPDNPAGFRVVLGLVPLRYVEDAPEALGAILAHLGVCEVVRG